MSANPVILPSAGRQNEPSMEEILASIRRIISDDNPSANSENTQMVETHAHNSQEEEEDILDLAEVSVAKPSSSPRPQNGIANSLEVALGVSKPAPPLVEPRVSPPPVIAPPIQSVQQLEERILSEETGAMISQAMQTLSRQTTLHAPIPGRSIEDVVVEALRPVLRNWMDDNLPNIVERLVKAEIERVTRGG